MSMSLRELLSRLLQCFARPTFTPHLAWLLLTAAPGLALAADPKPSQIEQALHSGQLAKAKAMIDQVLKDRPTSSQAHYVAAEVHAAMGHLDLARHELSTAKDLAPGLPYASQAAVQALESKLGSAQTSSGSPVKPSIGMGMTTESAPVEQVVDATENGYRGYVYIVRWHGARVAVTEATLQDSHLQVGDKLSFLVSHEKYSEPPSLSFVTTLRSTPTAPQQHFAVHPERGSATVQEVLKVDDQNYQYRAYIALWHGKRVVIDDSKSKAPYSVGQSFPVDVQYEDFGHKLLTIDPEPH